MITRTSVKRFELTAQVLHCGCGNPRKLHKPDCPSPIYGATHTNFVTRCLDCGDHDGDEGGIKYHVNRECRLEGIAEQERI